MTANAPFISLREAADTCGVSVKTLRKRISEGQLPAYRVASRTAVRVKRTDVEALIVRIPTAGQ